MYVSYKMLRWIIKKKIFEKKSSLGFKQLTIIVQSKKSHQLYKFSISRQGKQNVQGEINKILWLN